MSYNILWYLGDLFSDKDMLDAMLQILQKYNDNEYTK